MLITFYSNELHCKKNRYSTELEEFATFEVPKS
jgi:hypothetical protein